jgi:hypothetical protein
LRRIVAFADVQGNPHAVAAILLAAKKVDDAELVCLGNAFGPGPDPQACVEKLRRAHVHLVRGAWESMALGMPGGDAQQRLAARDLLGKLDKAEVAYLKEATPPRRLVAGGKRILLTSEPAPAAGAADVVLHPGARAVTKADGARLDVSVGNASADEHGESPFVVYDTELHEAKVAHAAWDRMVLRKNRYGEATGRL